MVNVLRVLAVISAVLSSSPLFAAATTKRLSTNITIVNLTDSVNSGQIKFYKPDGSEWREPVSFSLAALGDQFISRQYGDSKLSQGTGSVVVEADGEVGTIVQIQARDQIPTSGAYLGISEPSTQANIPFVSRHAHSASGKSNSQITFQNTSASYGQFEVTFYSGKDGSLSLSKSFHNVAPYASVEYDLAVEAGLPEGWFGSAIVRATTDGTTVAAISNSFIGEHTLQTFNAFTKFGREWYAPLFASRLKNSLSSPITVQNVSGTTIPAGEIKLFCTKDASAGPNLKNNIETSNKDPVGNSSSVFFNPVTDDETFPPEWFGSCIVTSGAYDTAMFVQMRRVAESQAGAYEGIPGDRDVRKVMIPLYAKRLKNGFASAVTIQNMNQDQSIDVILSYKGEAFSDPSCTQTFVKQIPAGGSIIQNHRLPDGPNSLPDMKDGCLGTLTVTSNHAIDAFVQLEIMGNPGDAFMAHNALAIPR